MDLLYKPNAQEALDRFEAWWLCENDVPLVEMRVTEPYVPQAKTFGMVRDEWFDFRYRLDRFEEWCQHTHFLADSFPAFNPNLGPDLLSTLWGTDMQFAQDTTWVSPIASCCRDILKMEPDFDGALWRSAIALTEMSLERGSGRWMTMFHDLHPNADIPAALLGPEILCMEFADDLASVRAAIEHVTPTCIEAYQVLQRRIALTGQPTLTWLPAPHQGRMYVPQCDFSAMISTDMFEEAVLPSIRKELDATDRAIYHLDGPDALRHLDLLLEIPQIHGIQWVYGAGNGPALRWTHIYERIQKAGKCMQILAENLEDAIELNKRLAPNGVLYSVGGDLDLEEANDYIRSLGAEP